MGRGGLTRRELLVAGAGATFVLVTGCGGSPREEITAAKFPGGTTYDGPPLTLDFWNGFTGGDGPQMLTIIDAFTKEHPNVKVRMVTARWEDFYTKFPAAISSGKGPDVAVAHSDQLPINAAHGAIVPLDDLVADLGLSESDFAPDVWRPASTRTAATACRWTCTRSACTSTPRSSRTPVWTRRTRRRTARPTRRR